MYSSVFYEKINFQGFHLVSEIKYPNSSDKYSKNWTPNEAICHQEKENLFWIFIACK